MKIIFCLFIFFCLGLQAPEAQPGGGGGIQVMKIIVPDGVWVGNHQPNFKTISKKDTALKINSYFLTLTNNKEIRSIVRNTALENYSPYDFADKVLTHVYLPPFIRRNKKDISTPDQRLELIYKGDTMTLDFFDIMQENGAGYTDKIDTITFFRGTYFKCYRNVKDKIDRFYSGDSTGNHIRQGELDSIYRFMQMGFTYYTLGSLYPSTRWLEKYGLIQEFYSKPAMTIFLRQGKYDTLWLRSFPIYGLDLKNISIQSNKIDISSDEAPVLVNNELMYKFYLPYTPVIPLWNMLAPHMQDQEKVGLLFQQLKTIPLEINDKLFSGTIKWLIPFRNVWYSGVSLIIHTFKNGILIKEEVLPDVDPDKEWRVIRPNG
jgi:hypothetical protein